MSPSVDLFGVTERLLEESKTRCRETARQPGGGGINVARTLHRLGADVLAVFTCGGANGELLERMLRDEGVACLGIPVDTDMRSEERRVGKECRSGEWVWVDDEKEEVAVDML